MAPVSPFQAWRRLFKMLTRVPLCCLGQAMVVLFRACNCLLRRADPLPHWPSHLSFSSQQLVAQTRAKARGSWNCLRGGSQNTGMKQIKTGLIGGIRWNLWTAALEYKTIDLEGFPFLFPGGTDLHCPKWQSYPFLKQWFSNFNFLQGNEMQISGLHLQMSESGEKPRELHV